MKLSARESAIISSIFLDADKSVAEICRETRYHPTTVRRILHRLYARGILRRAPLLDVYALGFTHYGVFFSITARKKNQHAALIEYLVNSEQISFLVELGGDVQFGISICARTIDEVYGFLAVMSKKFGDIFFEKSVAIRTQLIHFTLKYLSTLERRPSTLRWGIGAKRVEIDDLDHRVLRELSEHAPSTVAELARSLKIPYMTAEHRLRRLREKGVVLSNIALFDESRFGILSYYLLVYTRGLSLEFKQQFLAFCEQHPHIYFVVENLGSWDYEIGAQLTNLRQVTDITRPIYDQFGDQIVEIKVLPVFAYHKVRNYPFLKRPE